jgi:hypothetical protein
LLSFIANMDRPIFEMPFLYVEGTWLQLGVLIVLKHTLITTFSKMCVVDIAPRFRCKNLRSLKRT